MRLSLPGPWLGVMNFVAAFSIPAATQAEDELPLKLPFIAALQKAVREDDNRAGALPGAGHWEGVMVGEGGRNIWLNDFGTQPKYEIITINDND